MKRERYAPYWNVLSGVVRFALGKATCRHCGALHGFPHPVHGKRVRLATAHLVDKAPLADRLENLAALCQWCHLAHDAADRNGGRPRHSPRKATAKERRLNRLAKAPAGSGKVSARDARSLRLLEAKARIDAANASARAAIARLRDDRLSLGLFSSMRELVGDDGMRQLLDVSRD